MADQIKQIDSTIDVVTPENIAFQYELAGPFRRCPAFLIDLGVRFSIWVAVLLLAAFAGLSIGTGGELILVIWLLLWFVLEWFYGGLLETYWNGQTVGKRLLGMRVLRVDGQPINGLQAILRNFLRLVDMMPLIPVTMMFGLDESPFALPTCLFGLITPMFNRRFQRLGDLVCGTMVVMESHDWRIKTTQLEDVQVRRLAEELPASLVASRKMSQALATYVERRRHLAPNRREEIARHLAEPIAQRWNLPAHLSADLLLCALYYRTFAASNQSDWSSGAELVESPASRVGTVPSAPVPQAVPVVADEMVTTVGQEQPQ